MTKSLTTRVGSLSRARPLLTPFDILLLNNDNTLTLVPSKFRGFYPSLRARCTSPRGVRGPPLGMASEYSMYRPGPMRQM